MKAVEGVASMARSVGGILIVQCSDRKIESNECLRYACGGCVYRCFLVLGVGCGLGGGLFVALYQKVRHVVVLT